MCPLILKRNTKPSLSFRKTHTQPHTLLGSALGLLLVFRTNAAYQRFQEGRKLWEEVLNVSRDIARMTSLYEDGELRPNFQVNQKKSDVNRKIALTFSESLSKSAIFS